MDYIEKIELNHHPFLAGRFASMNLDISDYTFANVYLFRNVSRYQILTRDCASFISACNRQGQNYIMPLASPENCSPDTLRDLLNRDNFFFPIPEKLLPFFPEKEFRISFDEGESDYIYLSRNLATFAGKTYTRHRNHLNQFRNVYQPVAQILGREHLSDAMSVLQSWQAESIALPAKTDFAICAEALENFSALALWGTIYYIAEKPAGMIIGEPLNRSMFCLHFAKASRQYHGIYEFMFNDTAKKLQARYPYLNLEEDMGNKNLRKTKSSYGPERILKKYRVGLA
jgi:uncharacterized protein